MGSKRYYLTLEINGEVVDQKMMEWKQMQDMITRWRHTYPLKSMKLEYQIYVTVMSAMTSQKFKKNKTYINYETNKTNAVNS